MHWQSGIIIVALCISLFLLREKKSRKWTYLTIMIVLLITRIPHNLNVSREVGKNISFQHMQRISDVKVGDHSQSYIATIDGQRYMVFAPVNFDVGLTCFGKGEFKRIDAKQDNSMYYYFQSQKISTQIIVAELTCQDKTLSLNTQYFRDKIQSLFSIYGTTGSLYFMLLFGGGSGTTLIETKTWQTLGIIHLISLSGLQVQLIFTYFSRLYHFFPIGEGKRKWIDTILLFIYGVLCIQSLAFVRIIFVYLLETWGLQKWRLSLQMISTFLFLLIWPECYYNIGFWYSVLMQCTLIYISIIFQKYQVVGWRKMCILAMFLFMQTTLISMLYYLPISPAYVFTNFLFISMFEFVLLPILLLGICFLPLQETIIVVLGLVNQCLSSAVFYVENRVVHVHEAMISLIASLFMVYNVTIHKHLRIIAIGVILPFCLLISSLCLVPRIQNTRITFLDVGQGDSSIIYLAESNTLIVIDTGAPNPYYLAKLKQHLYKVGKTHIDYFIVTHADNDHSGNAKAVLSDNEIQPKMLLLPNTMRSNELTNIANANHQQTEFIDKTSTIFKQITNAELTVLNPGYHLENENEESIVLQLKMGNNTIIFQADAGEAFENVGTTTVSKVTLLKVAHHGSHTGSSQSYIQKIKPKFSVISAGKHNRYNHPHKEVISRLAGVGSRILQTKEQGDIQFQCTQDNCYQI